MDSSKLKKINNLCADFAKVAMSHGMESDFSKFSDAKGGGFKFSASFRKPAIGGPTVSDLFLHQSEAKKRGKKS